jgi:hypothetical protein
VQDSLSILIFKTGNLQLLPALNVALLSFIGEGRQVVPAIFLIFLQIKVEVIWLSVIPIACQND